MGPGPGGPGGPMGPGPGQQMMNMMPGKWFISKFVPKIKTLPIFRKYSTRAIFAEFETH